MSKKILRAKDINVPRSTLNDWEHRGLFPRFFKIGGRASAVYEDEAQRIFDLRAGGADDHEVKAVVAAINQERLDAAEAVRLQIEKRAA
jgi:hypothetical protein